MPPGGIPFGNYTLLRRLARGGMAEVFVARQRAQGEVDGWGRAVAIKRILPHLADTPEFTRMFLAEAKLAARLSHPNIVHIYDVGRVDEDYFIAMELVDGVHGALLVQHPERLPATLLGRIGADAAAALHHAHAQEASVVHRDVSPHNLMVSFDGVVKLVDFGIAKALGAGEATRPGVVKGKYAYMSPEQAMGRALDGKSDVFSLGLVLWELAAGRYAFERGDPAAVMRAIRDGRVPAIDDAAPGLPAPLAEAVRWALAHDAEQRPTAAELGAALEAFIKSAPGMATSMELAAWVRARFERNASTEPPTVTEAVAVTGTRRTLATAATPQTPVTAPTQVTPPADGMTEGMTDDMTDDMTIVRDDVGTDFLQTAIVASPAATPDAKRETTTRPRARVGLVVGATLSLGGAAALAAVLASRGGTTPTAATTASPDAIAVAPTTSRTPTREVAPAPAPAPTTTAAASPPDAAPAPAPAPASLDVVTTPPGAIAIVAGERLPTPATFDGLTPGTTSVHVEAAGYLAVDRELPLAAGEHRRFDVRLVRKTDIAHEAAPAAARTGSLSARTSPYSEVYEGARHLGETPFADLPLPAGPHTLTFKNPGHAPVTRRVTIRAGQTTKLAFDLP